jgi:hypothetical protein
MFSSSVVDQVRLSFGHVVQNYTIHARVAERLAARGLRVRMAILALLALAVIATVLSTFFGHVFQIAAAIAAGLALVGYTIYVATNIETRLQAHRSLAHRLWLMCERYRSLLAEVQDGLLDHAAILERREKLIDQVHAIYEQGFSMDQQAFETARQPPGNPGNNIEGAGFSEQQIDQYLPASIRSSATMRPVGASVPH